ncbi:MAG TPA: chemotaxis protein CheB [Candidatus Angelobacter sp.]|jgi:two-component system CheB/CheR fusion protein|nr:chemotaxis protein CheB [Candidatus Angelobacter sp.]
MSEAKANRKSKQAKSNPATKLVETQIVSSESFPIVGVGASAGGLEAFIELLKALHPKLGMAFVLVPHLDPTHESAMKELLGRATRMPVLQVEHGMRTEPDHVYVIPPGREMTIKAGVLQLVARRPQQPPMPIDIFFRSLAEDQRNNAVGVILSGTASDGTLGLAAIKGEGGITFAQDSKSAKYDGMPNSAVASGVVDFVLPPARIAEELKHIRKHPYISVGHHDKAEALEVEGAYDLGHLFRILKQVSKVDFSDYKPATIQRRILRRMALRKIDNLSEYINYVRAHRGEAEALYQDILINVTSFFRNPDMFDALKQTIYQPLLKERPPNDTIRIWVPGCSTGEEAYSHAISIVEYITDIKAEVSIQIFGTDLSETAIQKARTGIYKENIAVDVFPPRLRRFFNKVEGEYQISKSIRDLCIFARQNVFNDPPFSKMDIVSCRNLLIYLGPALQRRVVPVFHYALRPNGFLILGNTEGLLGAGSDLFDLMDKKNKIYLKRAVASPISFGFTLDRFDSGMVEAAGGETKERERKPTVDLQKEADRLLLARYVPAAVVVNEDLDILQTRGHTGRYLELSPGKASLNLLRMARPGLLFELQKALEAAQKANQSVTRERIQVENNGALGLVNIEIIPFQVTGTTKQNFLIVFHDTSSAAQAEPARETRAIPEMEQLRDKQTEQLKQELAATKEYLQSIIEEREGTNEELQSANEEIQSANEELQSTNEELQTSKEELESANEELNTVNEEMQHRNHQLSQLNNDLTNLLNSVNIPIVMLGPDLSVRRYTMQAEKMLGLSSLDVGRPITNLRLKVNIANLEESVLDVIRDVVPKQEEFQDSSGSWYNLRITPYRTSDNKIEGAVLVLLDTTETRIPQRKSTR